MSEKRFPASVKRLLEARQSGDLARAPLFTKGAALLGALVGLWWQAPALVEVFQRTAWLDWSLVWWSNTRQILSSIGIIVMLSALGAYLLGSLAGGFVFGGPLRRRRSSPGPDKMSLLSLLFAFASVFFVSFLLLRVLSELAWLGVQPEVLSRAASLILSLSLLMVGAALVLGVGQAVLSWYFWNQRHRRSYQEFSQDTKDEEGQAKQFFSTRLNKR
jgi:flagellar biosynthesis protein FlhB